MAEKRTRKPQAEQDAKWLQVLVRIPIENEADLDALRKAEPDLPTRGEMLRRCFSRELHRFKRSARKHSCE